MHIKPQQEFQQCFNIIYALRWAFIKQPYEKTIRSQVLMASELWWRTRWIDAAFRRRISLWLHADCTFYQENQLHHKAIQNHSRPTKIIKINYDHFVLHKFNWFVVPWFHMSTLHLIQFNGCHQNKKLIDFLSERLAQRKCIYILKFMKVGNVGYI